MKTIDFHSHILPALDDGSKSIEMTERMLSTAKGQGIDAMVATPHFYAERMRLPSYLQRRQEAWERTRELAADMGMELFLGAEVAFFPGIGRAEEIVELCIQGTSLMLVEMPFRPWTEKDLNEIEHLMDRGIRPIIAHLERFPGFQRDKSMVDELMEMPVLIQVNTGPLLHWNTRRPILRWLKNGQVDLLGSDAHNLDSRAVNLALGRQVIRQRLGQDVLDEIDRTGQQLLRVARTQSDWSLNQRG